MTTKSDDIFGTTTAGEVAGVESSLSPYAGPYVTDMLGKGQALSDMGYQAYTGPLTAGASDLQETAFEGIGGLNIPTDTMGAFSPTMFTAEQASAYMNPYLEAAIQPQIDAAIKQADIQRLKDASRLTQAGAFGGSRQAIMESEGVKGLMDTLSGITGRGYATAYDKAMDQFNREQDFGLKAQEAANRFGLAGLAAQAELGAIQRGIESEGVAADLAQFEEEREFPYKNVQFLQSLLQGLPITAQSRSYVEPSGIYSALGGLGTGVTTLDKLNKALKEIGEKAKPATTTTNTADDYIVG